MALVGKKLSQLSGKERISLSRDLTHLGFSFIKGIIKSHPITQSGHL